MTKKFISKFTRLIEFIFLFILIDLKNYHYADCEFQIRLHS